MAAEIDIWKLALSHVADRANVQATTENSAQADLCRTFYPFARDQALSEHAWSFATKRIALAELTNDVESWEYKYQLPADNLKVLAVLPYEAARDHDSIRYLVEGEAVYANEPTATLRYIFRQTTTGRFSTEFVIALSRLLASYLAGPLLKGRVGQQVAEGQMKMYILALGQAKTSDGNQDNTHKAYVPAGIMARNAGIGFEQVAPTDAELRAWSQL